MIDLEKTKMRDCPFCGGKPWIDYDPETKKTFVSCRECGARTVGVDENDRSMFQTDDEAIAFVIGAWERTPED